MIAFGTSAGLGDAVQYGLYVDIDHVDGAGATSDPLGKPITVDPLATCPSMSFMSIKHAGRRRDPRDATYYRWTGTAWLPRQTLAASAGTSGSIRATQALQLLVPYTALGTEDPTASGSLALTVFTTERRARPTASTTAIPVQRARSSTGPRSCRTC